MVLVVGAYISGIEKNRRLQMKIKLLAVLPLSLMVSEIAFADNHSVSIGYAQSKVQDFKDIRGVNPQYRYEFQLHVRLRQC